MIADLPFDLPKSKGAALRIQFNDLEKPQLPVVF